MEQFGTAALLLGAVAIVTAAFRRMGWNPTLGLIAAGVTLGPHGFRFVQPGGAMAFMAELGVQFLMFLIGLELSTERIRGMARYIFGLGAGHFLLCALLLSGFAWLVGEAPITAVVLGIALAMSSTAFVLQTLADTGQIAGSVGRKSFAVLLFQDLLVAPILALLPLIMSLAATTPSSVPHHSAIPLHVASIAMMMIFVVSRLVLQLIIGFIHDIEAGAGRRAGDADSGKREHERQSCFLPAIISVALSMGVAAHHFGLSASLGAFLAGLALSGAEWRHAAKEAIAPLQSTFLGIFFIGLGAQVPLSATPVEMLLMAAAAAAVIAIKVGCGFLAAVMNGLDRINGLRVGLILAQAGEFSFIVIASAGSAAMSRGSADFWSGAAVMSLVCTPLLVLLAGRLRKGEAGGRPAPVPAPATTDAPGHAACPGERPPLGDARA